VTLSAGRARDERPARTGRRVRARRAPGPRGSALWADAQGPGRGAVAPPRPL